MENKKGGFEIYNDTTHWFSFKQRLLILLGKPLKQKTTITVDKEVEIIKEKTYGYIEDLFPKKSQGMMHTPFIPKDKNISEPETK